MSRVRDRTTVTDRLAERWVTPSEGKDCNPRESTVRGSRKDDRTVVCYGLELTFGARLTEMAPRTKSEGGLGIEAEI